MTKEKVGNKSYLALGNMAFRDGRYDEAIHYYKKCAAKYPELENIALKNKELAYSRVKKSAAKIIPAYKDRSSGIAAEDIDLINSSGLFDPAWYLKKYPAVTSLGEDPLVHYLKIGWQLGYNPSMKFNTKAYLDKNSDIAKVGINPLIHYVKWGKKKDD
jgi:tetratricopeptide (TPR) repeat protein